MKIASLPKKVIGDIADANIENSLFRPYRFVMGSLEKFSSTYLELRQFIAVRKWVERAEIIRLFRRTECTRPGANPL